MALQLLTVDLGNTRCKLRVWEVEPQRAPRLVRGFDASSHDAGALDLESLLDGGAEPALAVLSSVAERSVEARVETALRERLGARYLGTPAPRVRIECLEPARVGADRLFAASGAIALSARSCLVLDAGTALTVDAVAAESSDRGEVTARFLGGAIAAGPRLLASALSSGTARLLEVDPLPGARALGRDTREALLSGIVHGFRGAALELARRIGEASGLGLERIVVTGGARELLLQPPLFDGDRVEIAPDLVHLGLVDAARERLFEPRNARRAGAP